MNHSGFRGNDIPSPQLREDVTDYLHENGPASIKAIQEDIDSNGDGRVTLDEVHDAIRFLALDGDVEHTNDHTWRLTNKLD